MELQVPSQDVLRRKYLDERNGEHSVHDLFKRVARGLADQAKKSELTPTNEDWYLPFLLAMENGAIPGGRILANVGRRKGEDSLDSEEMSLINCTVAPTITDSMRGILEVLTAGGLSLKAGCGIGYEFSTLRPKGAYVRGSGSQTSGPLSFMTIFDTLCKTVEGGGGRRGAQIGVFDMRHPDVDAFMRAKREDGVFREFNLSLLGSEDFMDCVKKRRDWLLRFPLHQEVVMELGGPNHASMNKKIGTVETLPDLKSVPELSGRKIVYDTWPGHEGIVPCLVYQEVAARELFHAFTHLSYTHAEPGFLLIDRINQMNNMWWLEEIRTTNPCVTGDTQILTETGYQAISCLVGTTLNIWNGFYWSEVTPKITGRDQPIYDIEFSDGSILSCTPGHKFILKGGLRHEARDLKVGDTLQKCTFPLIEGKKEKEMEPNTAYTQGFYSGVGQDVEDRIKLPRTDISLLVGLDHKGSPEESVAYPNTLLITLLTKPKERTFVPGTEYSVRTRLNWLSGLIASEGVVVIEEAVVHLQSEDRKFLTKVKYLLNTLGTTASLKAVESIDGWEGRQPTDFSVRPPKRIPPKGYQLDIPNEAIRKLMWRGLDIQGLKLFHLPKKDESPSHVTVLRISKREDTEDTVYCFNEPENHSGIFNGVMTAQCGEQPLPPNGACLLGSVDLTKFVKNAFRDRPLFDFQKLGETVVVFTRMLDTVVDIANLPLPEQTEEIESKRRHGMGIMGLGSALTMMKVKYGSDKAIAFVEEVMRVIALEGWRTSAQLAQEKGEAPVLAATYTVPRDLPTRYAMHLNLVAGGTETGRALFLASKYFDVLRDDSPKERHSPFASNQGLEYLRSLSGKSVLANLEKLGSRFTHHTTIAPTGTTALSIGNNVSGGIEPSFSHKHNRKIKGVDGASVNHVVFSKEFLEFAEFLKGEPSECAYNGWTYDAIWDHLHLDGRELPDYFVDADDIHWMKHIDMQAAAQKWVDASISKTINVARDTSFEEFQDVYQYAYREGVKGCTVFRMNPAFSTGILSKEGDLEKLTYKFTTITGEEIVCAGNEQVEYRGKTYLAAHLAEAFKEGDAK